MKQMEKKQKEKKQKELNMLKTLMIKYPNERWIQDEIFKNPSFNMNFLDNLVFPDKKSYWAWEKISQNPNFQIEWIQKYPIKLLDNVNILFAISSNQNFTIDWIKKNPTLEWNWFCIARYSNFQIEWIKQIPKDIVDHHIDGIFQELSKNKLFRIEWVLKYPKQRWIWYWFYTSNYFEIEWLRLYDTNLNSYKHIWHDLSTHQNMKLNWILQYPNEKWDWDKIEQKSPIINELITRFPNGISIKQVNLTKNKIRKWNWKQISKNPHVNFQFIVGKKGISHESLAVNMKIINMKIINVYFQKHWHGKYLCRNKNMSLALLDKLIGDKRYTVWDWKAISNRPDLTVKFIENHKTHMNFHTLSKNSFYVQNKRAMCKFYHFILKKYMLTKDIETIIFQNLL